MAETFSPYEIERWRALKAMKSSYMTWPEIVNALISEGLLECQNRDGTPHVAKRVSSDGIPFCSTCENTVTQFWLRNVAKLKADQPAIDEVAWHWRNAHEDIERVCREKAVRTSVRVSERVEMVSITSADGTVTEKPVTTRTTTTEWLIDRGLLHLRSIVHDKMARMAGIDVDDADDETDQPRGKTNVNRHPGADQRDGGAVN